jgi:hypothetical protein
LDALFKELGLKPFLICCSIGTHSFGFSPNIPFRKEVAGGGGGRDVGGRLSRDIIKGGGMEKHGLGVKVMWGGLVSGEKGMPGGFQGVEKGPTKFSSLLGEKNLVFRTKELTVSFA